jgi:hypothetical protein
LNGRAFFFQYGIGGTRKKKEPAKVCGFVHYGKASHSRRSLHGEESSDELWANLPKRVVYAIALEGQFEYEGCKVQSRVINHDDVRDFHEETKNNLYEVTKEIFEAEYLVPANLSKMIAERWTKNLNAPGLNYRMEKGEGDLDLPFITLEGLEGSIVGEPVFRIDSDRLLVSPNSREWVKNKILEEQETDRRCRHLYEACDMSYVERKEEAMRSLRIKLKI